MAYPHKWSPISYKSSAGQRKDTGQRPMLYRWTTQPTPTEGVTYIQQGDHQVGHWPTFLVISSLSESLQCFDMLFGALSAFILSVDGQLACRQPLPVSQKFFSRIARGSRLGEVHENRQEDLIKLCDCSVPCTCWKVLKSPEILLSNFSTLKAPENILVFESPRNCVMWF